MKKRSFPTYEEAQRIVQSKGIKGKIEYGTLFKELGLPAHPQTFYKGKGWIDWYDFLGKEGVAYPTYEEAQRIVQDKGIKGAKEYQTLFKELGLPSSPHSFYKGKGWIDWYVFLGKGSYPTYEEAQRIVQDKGIKRAKEYQTLFKELGLPSNPQHFYKGKGWIDWYDFLGKEGGAYPTYEEAKRIVQDKGIKGAKEYQTSFKELGLPSSPQHFYKGKGWIDWYDFLGKSQKVSPVERKSKILKEFLLTPTLLMDDELLQIIFIMAPYLDKKWVEEIQSLLGTTSYEERLKWVKDQLKGLKESGVTKSKTPTGEDSEELSVLVPVMEEFEETIDDWSTTDDEEDQDEDTGRESVLEEVKEVMGADKVKTLLDNYYHSIVNRELIKEVDGE